MIEMANGLCSGVGRRIFWWEMKFGLVGCWHVWDAWAVFGRFGGAEDADDDRNGEN